MSRQIDPDKPLSAEDRDYLQRRGEYVAIARNDARFAAESAAEASDEEEGGENPPDGSSAGTDDDSPEFGTEEWFAKATIPVLKEELKKRELPVSGTKDELVSRLDDALADEFEDEDEETS